MRFLVLTDLHANWPALKAVLADAAGLYDTVVCCGDLVGYNPDPARVLAWTRENCAAVVRGNHDKVVAGVEGLEWFNDVAQTAARWTIEALEASDIDYLRALPQGPARLEHFHLWHGSPRDEDEYVTSAFEAKPNFAEFSDPPLAFFGHTHLQGGFFSRHGRIGSIPAVRTGEADAVFELDPDTVYMVNPGSVGQPRDGDPRAAYALFDSSQRTVTLRRVVYPISETVEAIRRAGLPDVLGVRLLFGR